MSEMVCARCGTDEDRIDGYCSVVCQDMAPLEARIAQLEVVVLAAWIAEPWLEKAAQTWFRSNAPRAHKGLIRALKALEQEQTP